jgi:hypothetical protein
MSVSLSHEKKPDNGVQVRVVGWSLSFQGLRPRLVIEVLVASWGSPPKETGIEIDDPVLQTEIPPRRVNLGQLIKLVLRRGRN